MVKTRRQMEELGEEAACQMVKQKTVTTEAATTSQSISCHDMDPQTIVTEKATSLSASSAYASRKSRRSISSFEARKKKLMYEAVKRKAEIDQMLIDKELEADLASLEEEYSSHAGEDCTIRDVDNWIDSQQNLETREIVPENGPKTDDLPPPTTTNVGTMEGTIQLLATAVKNLSSTTGTQGKSNNNLLSRICTPRDLPDFAGDPLDWLQFKRAYEESSDVCNFTPKENLWRLRKCLRGPAKDAVSALLISATSPERIMDTLELRFGDPDSIISRLMQDIKRLSPISHDYQKDIVQFSVKVQNFVEAVRAVGRDEYLHGINIVSIILSKLPTILISKWTDFSFTLIRDKTKPRLDIMSEFLSTEAVKVSTTANVHTFMSRTSDNYKYKHQDGNARQHNVLVQSEHRESINKCQFCNTSIHKLSECKKFKKSLSKVRWQYVKRYGICYKCIESKHARETCPAPVCDKDNCGRAHHKLLHYTIRNNNTSQSDREGLQEGQREEPPTTITSSSSNIENVMHVNGSVRKVLLKVVPVRVYTDNNDYIDSHALLDDGSTVTMISANLATRAGLHGRQETMRICGPWTDNEIVCNTTVLNLRLSGLDNKVHHIRARSVNELSLPTNCLSVVDYKKYCHLKEIENKLCDVDVVPEILIGQDNFNLLLPLKVILGKKEEPCATLTPLGWSIHGSVRLPMSRVRCATDGATLLVSKLQPEDPEEHTMTDLHEEVRKYFTLESMGVAGKPRLNSDDVRAVEQLEQTAQLIEGRWHVGLPWTDPNAAMPDTFPRTLKRLHGVERKMGKDPGYAKRYVERIDHLLDNDFAKELKDTQRTNRTWYLPHFGVDNPNKKKLRLVFDAADKTDGMCLNDYLLKGPDLLIPLFGIMLRFRENRIAVTGDIQDMFLRIKVHPEDQDAFRFLWRSNSTEPVKTYVMTSLIFGAKCSPFVAQYIKNKNALRYQSVMPDACDAICKSHYMDDYVESVPDEETAIKRVRDITNIYKEGGFHIRNWTSNSLAVLDSVPKGTLGTAAVKFKFDQECDGERTLGLMWYPDTDELGFNVSFQRIPECIMKSERKPTKKLMLCVVMTIWDIFGFLSPITIRGKIMLQDTWRLNIGWDDLVSNDIFPKWCEWISLLKEISKIRIPRCYQSVKVSASASEKCKLDTGPSSDNYKSHVDSIVSTASSHQVASNKLGADKQMQCYNDLELHIFCDASQQAMCAVAYLRWITNNEIHVAFVASKCRVAPVKSLTIPRLELQAALLAARLADTIVKEHKIKAKRRVFWCDSTTVLHWIRNNKRTYKVFEANRLGEIDDLTSVSEWRYISTNLNIADLGTRDVFNFDLFLNEWFKGPSFLYTCETAWPLTDLKLDTNDSVNYVEVTQNLPIALPVPDPNRFSSWLRLLKSATAVLKFVNKCKKLTSVEDSTIMEQALCLLLQQAQSDSFTREITLIKSGKSIPNSSRLSKLTPYMDETGLIRVRGRIDAAPDVSEEVKRPIILDGRHRIAQLLVMHYHVKAAHGNQETVVNNLKQMYWLVRLRPTVKEVTSKCLICRFRKAKPIVPRMGDLPPARMAHHQRPFTFCGIDLFGPIEVIVGRRKEKRYGVLFTCLTVRAIHIEIVHSLTTDSLIMALRRMAARRAWPKHIFSDNGTNLRGSDTELRKSIQELDNDVLKSEALNYGTQWSFIPPASPHWGGAWERLIRSVKSSLKVILKERTPRDEVLSTLLAEVEHIVNSRPLTHVSVEPGSRESLTPNHFLLGSSSSMPIAGNFDDSDLSLRKNWRKAQRLADMYWQRWLKEYLPELIPRSKWNQEQEPLHVGDFVFVVDPNSPRNTWPRGIVTKLLPGKDGRIRVVDIKTSTGVLRRSVARVAPVPLGNEC